MTKFLLNFLLGFLFTQTVIAQGCFVFIGSYNDNANAEGIYVYRFDTASGRLEKVSSAKVLNPSYLTVSGNGRYIYACTETRTPNAGSVSSYAFNAENGTLTFISKQKSGGENPVYAAIDKSGKWLVNGNYTEGSVSVYPLDADGAIQPPSQIISFAEGSINKERQERAHIHAAVFSPVRDYLFLPDLGADKIRCYAFSPGESQPLKECQHSFTLTVPGSGPRHFTFHPNGRYAYCIEELSGTVTVFSYANGKLDNIQRIPAHNEKVKCDYSSADIHLSPDGLFLYASNRGAENNLAIFSVNASSGKLTHIGYRSTKGNHPRNFAIDPSGKFLLVANQVTGNVVVFKRDIATGLLSDTNISIKVPGASCVQIKNID